MRKNTVLSFWKIFLVLAPLLIMAGTAHAAEFWLRADITVLTMPDNTVVTMWGYALDADNDFTTVDGTVTCPGPLLEVPPGDTTLTIHLKNNLPEPTSLLIPGQIAAMAPVFVAGRVRSFTHEAAIGGEATYTWTNVKPGTYLYQSGSHPAVQVQMGLYGALKKNFAIGRVAYPGVMYGRESILLFSEVDPVIHAAVAAGDFGPAGTISSTINYNPKYFLMNGEASLVLTGIVPDAYIGNQILIRFLNAGLRTRSPILLGSFNYMTLIAEDGNVLPYRTEKRFSMTLYAGKTVDVMLDIQSASELGLYDRTGYVSAGAAEGTGTPTGQQIVGLEALPAGSTGIQTADTDGGVCFISSLLF